MKLSVLSLMLVFALISCTNSERVNSSNWRDSVKIDPSLPPEGMHLMYILMDNQSLPLKGTGCESSPDDKHTLKDLLATTFGAALGNGVNKRHQVVISGSCKAEKFELRTGSIIDGWRCTLNSEEKTIKKAEYIYSSSIAFGVQKSTWEFITDSITPNSLICMP